MITDRFTASDGVDLNWCSWVPEAPPRATVLLIHGVGEHAARYADLARKLTSAGYACYAFDHRGHGQSGGTRGHVERWGRYELDVVEFIEVVIGPAAGPATPLVVFGHSMGALIVLTLALTDCLPRRHGFLGLVVSGASLRPTGIARPALIAIARLLTRVAPRLPVNLGISPNNLSHDVQVAARYSEDPLVEKKVTVRWGTEILGAIESIKQGAGRIDLPMLIVHGGADPIVEAEGSRWLAEAVSGDTELLIYEDAFHEPHNEPDYADVGADISRWINRRLEEVDSAPTVSGSTMKTQKGEG